MAYELEKALITKVVEQGNLRELVRGKISPAYFTDEDTRAVFEWLRDTYDEHGKVPSLTLVQEQFPDFEPEDTDDDLKAIIKSIKGKKLYADLQVIVKKIATETKIDPFDGLEVLKAEASALTIAHLGGSAVDATRQGAEMKRLYRLYKKKKGLLGIPWPWKALNRATRGIRPGSFSAMYAAPGAMKTWLLIVIADFLHEQGYKPLFFTCEMLVEDIMQRWAAYRARVDYEKFQNGTLSRAEEKRFNRAMEEMQDDPPFIIEELESVGDAAITELRSKTESNDADVTLVDGLAFLSESLDWAPWDLALRNTKRMARQTRIPLIGTHHANLKRKGKNKVGGEVDDVALGDSLFRHTDNLIRVERTVEQRELEELGMVLRKVREGKEMKFFIHGRPAVDFGYKYSESEHPNYDEE